jgi:GNAT superfamily N-acetyltransferase
MIMRAPGPYGAATVWQRRTIDVRALDADDAALYSAFHASLGADRRDRRSRGRLPDPDEFSTRVQSDRDIAIGAVQLDGTSPKVLGIARAVRRRDANVADVGLVLPAALEGQGLGRLLMGVLIVCCRERGLRELFKDVRVEQRRVIELVRAFRFVDAPSTHRSRISLHLVLEEAGPER